MMLLVRAKYSFSGRIINSRTSSSLVSRLPLIKTDYGRRKFSDDSAKRDEIYQRIDNCGFSMATLKILQAVGLEDIECVNVLEDEEVRSGVKKYSSWPTIPQLFVKGEFLGGYDIVLSMYRNGELRKLLEEKSLLGEKKHDAEKGGNN